MKRNYGIDLLRMLLMLMVVILHVLGHGGILDATNPLTLHYNLAWLIETAAYCAVNCYAIISGYVYINGKCKLSSLLLIWLQTLTYSLGIAVCVWMLKPELFSLKSLVIFSTPVLHQQYWYVSAYVGLFVLIPFLNAAIHALTERQAKVFLAVSFVIFTVLPSVFEVDIYGIKYGYSTFWLVYMYVIGACIKKFGWGDKLPASKAALGYALCILISWGYKIGCEGLSTYLFGEVKYLINLISYTSPTIVMAAVTLFLAFRNIRISPKLINLIARFSPAAFGVYLIHMHECVAGHFLSNRFVFLTQYNPWVMIIGVFVSALVIFALCIVVDYIRHCVFQRMHVKEQFEKLDAKLVDYVMNGSAML